MFIHCPYCLTLTEQLEDKYILVLTFAGKTDTVIKSNYCYICDKVFSRNEEVECITEIKE